MKALILSVTLILASAFAMAQENLKNQLDAGRERHRDYRMNGIPLFQVEPTAENLPSTHTKQWFIEELGTCKYETAALRESNDPTCTTGKKFLCSVEARCQRPGQAEAGLVAGVCLVDKKCPSDPIDCFLKQSFKKIGANEDVIEPKTAGGTSGSNTGTAGRR